MSLNNLHNNLKDFALDCLSSGKNFDEIEKLLLQKTNNTALVAEIIRELKIISHAAKRKKGLEKLALALVLLIAGFIVTCVNYHCNQPFSLALYSLTGAGMIFLFWGLYEIIG